MCTSALILLLLGSVCGCWAFHLDSCSTDSYRLPKNIIPTHYDLTIDVDLTQDNFNGQVDIHLKVKRANEQLAQNQIAFHASNQLSIDEIQYKDETTGVSIEVGDVCRNKNDVVIVSLAQDLAIGSEGVLHITFEGKYGKELAGFYKSKETTSTGESYDMAVTQFEPIDARSAFPCFDEPAFKATFDITIIHDKDQTALSNSRQLSEEVVAGPKGERVKTTFATTPYMSTYLVAYVVGRFEYIEQVILDGRVTMRFYTPAGRTEQSRFSLDTAAKALPLLEDYFGIDFPLNKIDFVSVAEYSAGAMENWGLITMMETMLLDSPENLDFLPTIAAQTTVHELAHQWFGNLVTMEWWNDLWLNEGFANWVEYNMTAVLMPEINFNALFIYDSVDHVFKSDFDGLEEPVASKVHHENISNETISLIVYDKGSAIIKNLQQEYLHPDNFRAALRHYMKTHAYGNAKASDLWHSMELYSKEPVAQFMESWLYQDGHPILTVDVEKGFLTIKQSVFTRNKLELKDPEKRWIIPVTVLVSDSESKQEVISVTLSGQQETEFVDLPEWYNPRVSSHWLKLNCNATGLYNVEYSKRLLKNLRGPIEKKLMSPLDRLDIIINYGAVSFGDYILPVKFDKFLKWFRTETDYIVLNGLVSAFNLYDQMNREDNSYLFFKVFGEYLKNHALESQRESNSFNEGVRSAILNKAIDYTHKPTVNRLYSLLDETKPLDTIDEPHRSSLFYLVLSSGSAHQKRQLSGMVNKMEDTSLRRIALKRLAEPKKSFISREIKGILRP